MPQKEGRVKKRSYCLFVVISIALPLSIISLSVFGGEQESHDYDGVYWLEYSKHFESIQVKKIEKNNKGEESDVLNSLRQRATCDWWPRQAKAPCCLFCCIDVVTALQPTSRKQIEPP
jgi:hypothetical protein